jgi:hypothetical protein
VISSTSSMRDFDDNEFPRACLITLRCYGTWLHGDARGSMDPKQHVYGAPKIAANQPFENSNRQQLKHAPVTLDAPRRTVVEGAVRGVTIASRVLRAPNAGTNHVHCVGIAICKPEPVLDVFKAMRLALCAGLG